MKNVVSPFHFGRVFAFALIAASGVARGEGYGSADFMGTSHTVYRAAAQRSSADTEFVAVGRTWTGAQYRAIVAAYRASDGGQYLNFGLSNGLVGRRLFDFAESGYDNLCGAVTYAYDGYIAACRSMNVARYYDIYLVKFNSAGELDTTFGSFTATGTITSGSNVVTSLSTSDGIVAGQPITGTGIPANTTVLAVSGSSLTLSANATASSTPTLTFTGVKITGIGGGAGPGHALVRGIAYNSSGGTTANGGVVAIVGARGFYPNTFTPFIAAFDQKTGAAVGAVTTIGALNGTAVGVVYDSDSRGGSAFSNARSGGPGYYYVATTDGSGTGNFYVHRYDTALNAASSPWGDAIDFTVAGGGSDSVPAGLAVFDNNVVVVGGNRSGAAAWNCAAAALRLATGTLDTTFGSSTIGGGVNNQGITLFPNPTSSAYDCILNAATVPTMGGYLVMMGTGYNGTNYDSLSAEIDTKGVLVSSFGSSGVRLQSFGVGDDVINGTVLFGDIAKAYGVGRVQNSSLTNAGSVMEVTTTMSSTNTWSAISTTNAPQGRYAPSAIWTGGKMVIWGGCSTYDCVSALNDGGQYDPAANTWTPTATGNAPAGRRFHAGVWTGSKLIVWGGDNSVIGFNDGGQYDPATDTWSSVTTTNAPGEMTQHSAVWTGTKMIVWGGMGSGNIGGLYDPVGNSWTAVTTTNAPDERWNAAAAWTGSKMIVWSGWTAATGASNSGGIYDPTGNAWTIMSTTNAPTVRDYPLVVWTGAKMVAFSGLNAPVSLNDGGIYDPAANSWTPTTTVNAPGIRDSGSLVWTGSRMIAWGGYNFGATTFYNDGGSYDPAANVWTPIPTTNAPGLREDQPALWTGSTMIVWGGDYAGYPNTGGVYTPISGSGSGGTFTSRTSDAWTATTTTNAPGVANSHSGAWIGSKFIVWGGWNGSNFLNTGGSYDPISNAWTATTTTNAPVRRTLFTLAWTGSRLIAWGGDSDTITNTGGRYDPVLDSWSPTTTANAPVARYDHTADWTGTHMIVFGGRSGGTRFNSGGIYDPGSDSWVATTTTNAPAIREAHSSVWTGTQLIVFGGSAGAGRLNTGGRYDPRANVWLATNTNNAPARRENHTGVWTGDQMLVWGGTNGGTIHNTGGRYDPLADLWTPITTTNAPEGRDYHSAVWTGARMIVWGGFGALRLNSGGIYNPVTDLWTATTTTNAPSIRTTHVATWTGSQMVVWGGQDPAYLNTGGVYTP